MGMGNPHGLWVEPIMGMGQGGLRKKKKLPRVEFFISAILAGLTLLCNQAHAYIRKYDITDLGSSLPRCLAGRKITVFVSLCLQSQC